MRWSLPNVVTLGRLFVLPVVLLLLWPGIVTPQRSFWAMLVYALVGVFDVVDGALARRINQVTLLGKFLDPLADKVIYLVTLVALLQLPGPWVPGWMVMIALSRELLMTGLRGIAISEGITLAADAGGKLKTLLATVGICALIVHYPLLLPLGFGSVFLPSYEIGIFFTVLSLSVSLYSFWNYIQKFLKALT